MILTQGQVLDHSTAAAIDTVPISSGVVHPNAPGPMWQGLPVQEFLPPKSLGPVGNALMPAVSLAGITGFTVLNDAMLVTPDCKVPRAWPAAPGAAGPPSINVVRLGSRVRFVVAVSPSYAASLFLQNTPANTPLAWDFSAQWLVAGSPGARLPIQLAAVSLIRGRTVCAESDGTVRWKWPAAVAVVVL